MAEESKTLEQLRKAIARRATLVGHRIGTGNLSGDNLIRANIIVSLLTQAQAVAGSSENEARKLLAMARNIKTGTANESKKKTSSGKKRRVNS